MNDERGTMNDERKTHVAGRLSLIVHRTALVLPHSLRRSLALLVIFAYAGLAGFYLMRHAIGDTPNHPFAYFWTWDMYPNYPTESSRRAAVGVTEEGRLIRLFPNRQHRFRWGVEGDVTRLEIDRRMLFFRRTVRAAVDRYANAHSNDSLVRVYLVEQYWPVKFNLPQELYRSLEGRADSDRGPPQRRYWRILETVEVSEKGRIAAWEGLQ